MKTAAYFSALLLIFPLALFGKENCKNTGIDGPSTYCVQTYHCPPEKKLPDGVLLMGMMYDGSLLATVGIKKDRSSFVTAKYNSLTAAKKAYLPNAAEPSALAYTVHYDYDESGNCYFNFSLKGMKRSAYELILTEKSDKVDPAIHEPKSDEVALFGKTHKLCKKKSCTDDQDWGLNMLFGITDINKNGAKEYWFSWVDGYRTFYKAEEYDSKMKKWTTVAEF